MKNAIVLRPSKCEFIKSNGRKAIITILKNHGSATSRFHATILRSGARTFNHRFYPRSRIICIEY